MINGGEKCQPESQEIVDVCPNWALDGLEEKSRWTYKKLGIQNLQYQQAMKVSDYNEGKNVADVADKTWIDGTRLHLRPDTMWADERYAKVTQAEINEAKKRIASQKKHGKDHSEHEHHEYHYDHLHVERKHEKPLYP